MIDLEQQLWMFQLRKWIVLDELRTKLQDPEYVAEIMRLAKERLQEGFKTYGDTMYRWDEDTRIDNMNQELADYIVYGTSREL